MSEHVPWRCSGCGGPHFCPMCSFWRAPCEQHPRYRAASATPRAAVAADPADTGR